MNAPFDVTGVELRTERLTLRPWRQSDLNDFFEYASVDGVGQMAGWLPHKDAQETQKILDSFIEKKKTFALDYQGKVIGALGVEYYDEKESQSWICCEPVPLDLCFPRTTGEKA